MAPPSAPSKPASHAARPSIGSTARTTAPKSTPSSRQSVAGSRLSVGPKLFPRTSPSPAKSIREEKQPTSPSIAEEDFDEEVQSIDARLDDASQDEQRQPLSSPPTRPDRPEAETPRARTISIPRSVHNVDSRTADKKEVEQLKAKIRTLEKKAMESRDKLKTFDTIQNDKERYETIIQTLQKKLKTNQQDMNDLRAKYKDVERQIGQPAERSAEHESEIELATLDKEMAEERAEMHQYELEALKAKHEELELEADILREENRELGSVMSPEEKASAGWMQMEREQERLRQALVALRDWSQESEFNLKSQVKELEETLDETDRTASQHDVVSERLARMEATNKHLMEQLEVAETNDEVVFAMEAQREQSQGIIEQLRKQVQDFEEHIQVTDELESFHVDEEKRLHHQLDESEALLSDKHRHAAEQEKVIEDLNYTLVKFRDVVQGLQSDIDELRRSKDISELEAHEMGSKSRAMMDLNIQLQSTAFKSQIKIIDHETGRMQAEQAESHLGILQLFVPDSFDADRNPILALLCFKRIKSKATLSKNLLAERMRDRPYLTEDDDAFTTFEVMEKMSWIASACERFVRFASRCSTEEFSRLSNAVYELEPVERSMTGWVDALKRDELRHDTPEHLQRMIGILQDMLENLIAETAEAKATELVLRSTMVETYADSTALQLSTISRAVQARLGSPRDEDEESQVFDKKIDQASTKLRTIKYLSGKVTQLLRDLRSGSMCLGEPAWAFFEDAEDAARQVCQLVRAIGKAVMADLSRLDPAEPLSYVSLIDHMTKASQQVRQEHDPRAASVDSVFTYLTNRLQSLQYGVDELQTKASDISSATEFETRPAPWTVRAKQIKAQKVMSQDAQEEAARLKARVQEQIAQLSEKDKAIEEQQIRVDLLENRTKEAKTKDADVKNLKDEVEVLKTEKLEIAQNLEKTKAAHVELLSKREAEKTELESLKAATVAEGGPAVVSKISDQSETARYLQAEVDILTTEILSLQSALRYFKADNQSLRVPSSELAFLATRNAWLDPVNLRSKPKYDGRRVKLQREGTDLLDGLIELASVMKPVKLATKTADESHGQRTMQNMTRWHTAKQREEVEQWASWRDDVLKKGRMEARTATRAGQKGDYLLSMVGDGKASGSREQESGEVKIVANSP